MAQKKATAPEHVSNATLKCIGFEQLSVGAVTAVGFTAATFDGASEAHVQIDTQNVRYRSDGATTAPTATVGTQVLATRDFIYVADLDDFRMISETGTAKANIHYYARL